MYLRKVEINNIRNIDRLELDFPEPAGWHVLIGDNGAGKTTILQAIAMGLIGPSEVLRLDPEWSSWVRKGTTEASISTTFIREKRPDLPQSVRRKNLMNVKVEVKKDSDTGVFKLINYSGRSKESNYDSHEGKRFGAGFGAFRRFYGGGDTLLNQDIDKVTPITPYQTLFKEGTALTSTIAWIKDLYIRAEGNKSKESQILKGLKLLVSYNGLLPGGLQIADINANGMFFLDSQNKKLHLSELSDGVKSVLALTLELVRLLLKIYNPDEVFAQFFTKNIHSEGLNIPVTGIVLIDEIDIHLHPSWQARIGQWFTSCFPNIQFIVTTHSPIICRAAEKGSIWRLSAPDSDRPAYKVKGVELQRLIYGNILEAFGTELFGEDTTSSPQTTKMLEQLARLNKKSIMGTISKEEKAEREKLLAILPTEQSA